MIKNISVKDLFGYHTYKVPLESKSENVIILHGPNGSGKTTVFKMLQAISDKEYLIFFEVPFTEFKVETDNHVLSVKQEDDGSVIFCNNYISFKMKEPVHKIDYEEASIVAHRALHKFGAVRLGPRTYEYEGEIYGYRRLCEKLLDKDYDNNMERLPSFLSEIAPEIDMIYIGAERLTIDYDEDDDDLDESGRERRVVDNTNKLKSIIKRTETQYAFLSKDLDANFPKRIITKSQSSHHNDIDPGKIAEKLQSLTVKRNELSKRGILSENASNELIPVEQITSDDILDNNLLKQFLSVYIEDNEQKLSVFDDLLKKMDVLEEMINEFFANKRIEVNRKDGYLLKSTKGKLEGQMVPLNKLSSGEQHFLVLFFELVFNTNRNQIVFIDEPEISLHVAWQLSMVDKLLQICDLNQNYFILATHSPSIIRNHRDLVLPMGYEDEE
ncbi:AAA family ATPase [Bacillus cereus]|uniref:ATPase n=1 Tax=Bacillus cereus TaxID=1396 RepID=A0A164BZT7_BACCE|nr:AAA family ATPase [Bacillus cereus]KZD27673.1 ATPase [Bacillus cereus]